MNLVPSSISRFGHRTLLKLNGASPTILVVAGVGGLVATSVLAARATRNIDPVLDEHRAIRSDIESTSYSSDKARQKDLLRLYTGTGIKLSKVYGPAIVVGGASAAAVLGGHKILRGRHVATLAAYSGLMEQFQSYRGRVAKTLGEDVEKGIYEGAHGEWKMDQNGEEKLQPVFAEDKSDSYLRPWFDETCPNWTRDPQANYLFLKGVQSHMNNLLQIRGHVFLNDVYDALRLPRRPEGAIAGWLRDGKDGYVDFGFMTSIDPNTVAFRNGVERTVRLNFNIDGTIWDKI